MRYFEQFILNNSDVFYKLPIEFNKYTEQDLLRYCVGAALYMPATRQGIAEEIIKQKYPTCTTIVMDLEDALGDLQVADGEMRLLETLNELQQAIEQKQLNIYEVPLLFVRIRNAEQLNAIIKSIGTLQHLLTGYVLPKFCSLQGRSYLQQIAEQNKKGYTLYAMPILESDAILKKQSRLSELLAIKNLLDEYESFILNVRIGSTDFCGTLGVRRSIRQTVYELVTIQDCFADIMNVFLSAPSQYVVSGSVWEYFGSEQAIESLIREIEMDRLNGLVGKTIIHPSHLEIVQAMYVVTHEEYVDAQRIVSNTHNEIGVEKSDYGNKMNEMKPHLEWAQRTLKRAQAYGVLQKNVSNEQLLLNGVLL